MMLDAGVGNCAVGCVFSILCPNVSPLRGDRTEVLSFRISDDNNSFVPFRGIWRPRIESGALIYPLYVPSGLFLSHVPKPSITSDPMAHEIFHDHYARGGEGENWRKRRVVFVIRSADR